MNFEPIKQDFQEHNPNFSEFIHEVHASFAFVYTCIERSPGKKHWLKIGIAFINKDFSINVRLDALPTNGQLYIKTVTKK